MQARSAAALNFRIRPPISGNIPGGVAALSLFSPGGQRRVTLHQRHHPHQQLIRASASLFSTSTSFQAPTHSAKESVPTSPLSPAVVGSHGLDNVGFATKLAAASTESSVVEDAAATSTSPSSSAVAGQMSVPPPQRTPFKPCKSKRKKISFKMQFSKRDYGSATPTRGGGVASPAGRERPVSSRSLCVQQNLLGTRVPSATQRGGVVDVVPAGRRTFSTFSTMQFPQAADSYFDVTPGSGAVAPAVGRGGFSSSVVSTGAKDDQYPRRELHAAATSFDIARIRQELARVHSYERGKRQATMSKASRRGFLGRYLQSYNYRQASFYHDPGAPWFYLDREMSSNVAGETGAVWIYKGAGAAAKLRGDAKVVSFCERHLQAEQLHLDVLQRIFGFADFTPGADGDHDKMGRGGRKYTLLLPLWKVAGYCLGFVPTFFGRGPWLYHTVEAVETFVEKHYGEQIFYLDEVIRAERELQVSGSLVVDLSELRRFLSHCCADEVHHKEDARENLLQLYEDSTSSEDQTEFDEAEMGRPQRLWRFIVYTGSAAAAELAKRI